MPENQFAGLRVVLTGGASGIGKATAQKLADRGANVWAADINLANLDDAMHGHTNVTTAACDVSREEDIVRFVAAAAEAMGGIDALVNMAGVLSFANATDVTLEEFNRIMTINVTGTFLTCREALPYLVESKGVIVNAASIAAHAGQAWATAYCASKGAVLAMSRSLAVEYGGRGVRVNTVSPGAIETPIMNAFAFPEGADQSLLYRTMPIGPAGQPNDAAAAIVMLIDPELAYINGADLRVDGATTA